MSAPTILVLGATGKQGGAVCRHLSKAGNFRILAITRDPDSDKARKVATLPGVELVQCDADVAEQLAAAFSNHGPVKGVYSVQTNDYTTEGSAREVSQGKHVVDLCKSHTVDHLVYSSVAELRPKKLMDVATKIEIEAHMRASGVPYTVLRPTFFVENFFEGGFAEPTDTQVGYPGFDSANPTEQKYIYIDDSGMIAAQVFAEREPWLGQTLELAGDSLSPSQIVEVFSHHNQRVMSALELPVDAFGPELVPLFSGMRDGLWETIDVDGLRDQFPSLHTVAGALKHNADRSPEET